jgi:hypothetical protein
MYKSDQFPDDMVTIVNEFVQVCAAAVCASTHFELQELIRDDFVLNMIALLKVAPTSIHFRCSMPQCLPSTGPAQPQSSRNQAAA